MVSPASVTSERRVAPSAEFHMRRPRPTDGRWVHALIARCPPLDRNSLYLNLLQCTHFAETCVLAEASSDPRGPAGFVSGYLTPQRPDVLFVWQVAIAAEARGQGLAKRMLLELLARPISTNVTRIETTITASNEPSWSLFRSLARHLNAPLEQRVAFDREKHLDGEHESEVLVTIGPFSAGAAHKRPLAARDGK